MEDTYLTVRDLVNTPASKRHPAQRGRLSFSKQTLYRLIKEGKFPKPVKLSDRLNAWKASTIEEWEQKRVNGGTDAR